MVGQLKLSYSGIVICCVTAIAATALADKYQAPVMLFALLLGLALHFLYESPKHQTGVVFCSKTILRIAVGLLGVRVAFSDIVSLGYIPPLMIAACMVATIVCGVVLAKLLKLPTVMGVLSGGSVAICGVSAAAAITTVLPKKDFQEKFFAITVIAVTTLSTLAMILYPLLTDALKLNDVLAGVFLGGSIHDVAQVIGAGYSISPEAGNVATFIKLFRVMLLLPIVLCIFFIFRDKDSKMEGAASLFPPFLIAFIVLATLKNLGVIPDMLVEWINVISSNCLVVAIVAIGIKTSLKEIVSVGWKPIFLITFETVFFAALILTGIMMFMS